VHVVEPQKQLVELTDSPVVTVQEVKAVVLHQLSELKQKRPVVDVHVVEPHIQLLGLQ